MCLPLSIFLKATFGDGRTFVTAISALEPEGAGGCQPRCGAQKGAGVGPAGLSLVFCHHPQRPLGRRVLAPGAPKPQGFPELLREFLSALPLFLKPLRTQLLYF